MQPTDLALSQALGIVAAPPGSAHLLELSPGALALNHVGTLHAAVQFALAEAASAACLQRDFPDAGAVFAVVRGAQVKYRRAATGDLLAYGRPDDATREHLAHDLATRTRASATVVVELKDRAGQLVFQGHFDWFIARNPAPAPDSA
ncbi:MAG: DUF4442 domain-containing protein [Candidatus Didemnitutus sp.]|nr:DUF4442 domain-containing protein [Candidatus Didemnitutus sp.]